MGQTWVREFHDGTAQAPDSVTPMQDSKPTFDPLVGFPNGRTPRVMNVTAEEMEAVQLQPGEKGYCADKFIAYKVCHWNNTPFGYRCNHERHAVGDCLTEDYKLRMMEYERERRLRKRAKRIGATGSEEMEEE